MKEDELVKQTNGPHYKQITPFVLLYIFNEKGEVLLLNHKNPPFVGLWESPSRHIKFGGKTIDAAKRELLEETGISTGNLKFVTNFDFILSDSFHRIGITYATKINSNAEIKLSEHDECKWFNIKNLPEDMIPGPLDEAYNLLFAESE